MKSNQNVGAAELLTDEDMAEMLRVGVTTVWRWTKAGHLPPPIKIAGATRWRRRDVLDRIERMATAESGEVA